MTAGGSLPVDRRWAEGRRLSTLGMIALTSFSILALELALIRWTSSQIRVFAYFNNIVLITSFLGMGVGVALGRRHPALLHAALPVLLIVAVPLGAADWLGLVHLPFPDQSITLWGAESASPHVPHFLANMGIFLALLTAIVAVFACASAPLGYLFGRAPVLRAYTADLAGALGGVAAFSALAWAELGPATWLAIAVVPLAWLSRRGWSALAAVVIIALGHYSGQGAQFSPYNRIVLSSASPLYLQLDVNRDFHQFLHNFSAARITDPAVPAHDRAVLQGMRGFYDLPFALNPQRRTALVVGAGTGNDVQAALRPRYASVTSVDIDGRIIELGREHHPEKPYSDPRVRTVVDDARSFFQKSERRAYDVVCYGLLDSHAMVSAMSTLRLDNYVYTEEGIRSAWECVAPGGHLSLALSCIAGQWFFERLYWTIARATGRPPTAIFTEVHGQTVTFIVATPEARLDAAELGSRRHLRPRNTMEQTVALTDDWPFLYLRLDVFPWGYAVVLGFVLVLTAVVMRPVFGVGVSGASFDWPLFLMGAAFLLVETRGVTSLSLLFGSTWAVNSAVFGGILTMVLAANLAVQRWQWREPLPWFLALFAAVALLYAFPIAWLQTLPLVLRGVIGGLLTGLPVGLAGVVVPMLLARAAQPTAALGANLLGAVLGGCLEYYSMLGGLKATALMALALYLVAFLLLRKKGRGGNEPAGPVVAGRSAQAVG